MRRVLVVGVSGAGKTTAAVALAARLCVPHVELDAIYHQPEWTGLPDEEFLARVREATAGEAWVVDGNYSTVRDVVWDRADTVVVLDLPRWRVMVQLLMRSLRRVVRGEELWNGNRERWRNLVRAEPEQNILRWSWTTHAKNRARYRAAARDPRWAHLTFLTATSRREIRRLLHARSAAP